MLLLVVIKAIPGPHRGRPRMGHQYMSLPEGLLCLTAQSQENGRVTHCPAPWNPIGKCYNIAQDDR